MPPLVDRCAAPGKVRASLGSLRAMGEVLGTVLTAAAAFGSTNIDDIFVLMLFYSQVGGAFRRRHVVIGQYLGFGALVAISTVGYFGTLLIPTEWVGFLGLAPIALGIRQLVRGGEPERGEGEEAPVVDTERRSPFGALLDPRSYGVAVVTFANGGDNIGVYVPLFARGDGRDLALTIGVFLLLVAVWCAVAAVLAAHPAVARVLGRYGHRIVPLVLIGLGFYILLESGTLALFGLPRP